MAFSGGAATDLVVYNGRSLPVDLSQQESCDSIVIFQKGMSIASRLDFRSE